MDIKSIKGVAYDSRMVRDGYCFVAIRGTEHDGHDFAGEAVKNGAAVIVSARPIPLPNGVENVVVEDTHTALAEISSEFFGHPSKKMRIAGITGTNGKTTVTYLVESIFKTAGRQTGVIGTISWRYKDILLSAPNTTPMAYDLQKILGEMERNGVTDVVMEVSSHALDQSRVEAVDFDSAVFTNLTRDHLDYHKGIDDYFRAKERLFTEFLKRSAKSDKCAVINADDEFGGKISSRCSDIHLPRLTYGFSEEADVTAEEIKCSVLGAEFKLKTPWGSFPLSTPLRGRFNICNIMAAAALAGRNNIPLDKIKEGIEAVKNIPGRFEFIPNNRGISVVVDYAHTPDAVSNLLSALKEISGGRMLTVFGCGGDRDKGKRPLMGEAAGRLSDVVIVTSDNPRTEDPNEIIKEIVEGIKKTGGKFIVESDRQRAIRTGLEMAEKGDVVLIAGKGHEDYQIIGNKKRHFDDREEVEKYFAIAEGR